MLNKSKEQMTKQDRLFYLEDLYYDLFERGLRTEAYLVELKINKLREEYNEWLEFKQLQKDLTEYFIAKNKVED